MQLCIYWRSSSGTVLKVLARLSSAQSPCQTALGMQAMSDAGASMHACGLAWLCAAHSA